MSYQKTGLWYLVNKKGNRGGRIWGRFLLAYFPAKYWDSEADKWDDTVANKNFPHYFYYYEADLYITDLLKDSSLSLELGAGTCGSTINQAPSPPMEKATLDDVREGLARLTDLRELEMLDRKIASLPTWPFDIQVVSRFVTIVLSVTAVLLSRVIANFLHIWSTSS